MNFGQALEALKTGQRVMRAGWNGKGMFVYLVPAASYPVQTGAAKAHFGAGALVPYNPYLAIKNVDETVSTWVPSVNDCLAGDWGVVGELMPEPSSNAHRVEAIEEASSTLTVTDEMVGRFLSWPLPADFAPDCGITFTRLPHAGMSPTGTNLLHFGQAKAMLAHCINGPSAAVGTLPPHQQRVLAEKMDLDMRISAMDACVAFGTASGDEQARLKRQLDVMHELSSILGERIAQF